MEYRNFLQLLYCIRQYTNTFVLCRYQVCEHTGMCEQLSHESCASACREKGCVKLLPNFTHGVYVSHHRHPSNSNTATVLPSNSNNLSLFLSVHVSHHRHRAAIKLVHLPPRQVHVVRVGSRAPVLLRPHGCKCIDASLGKVPLPLALYWFWVRLRARALWRQL